MEDKSYGSLCHTEALLHFFISALQNFDVWNCATKHKVGKNMDFLNFVVEKIVDESLCFPRGRYKNYYGAEMRPTRGSLPTLRIGPSPRFPTRNQTSICGLVPSDFKCKTIKLLLLLKHLIGKKKTKVNGTFSVRSV